MNKNTTFPNLLQKIISKEEINEILDLIGDIDTGRKLTVAVLVEYLVSASANEWKSFRECADIGSAEELPEVNHSTLSKKASHVNYEGMKRLFHLVVSKCIRATRRALHLNKIPKNLLLVDSTTITVGKPRLPWAVYHGERAGVKLHVSDTPESSMPLKTVETTGLVHDGPVGEQLASTKTSRKRASH